jgi:hypothetical protein
MYRIACARYARKESGILTIQFELVVSANFIGSITDSSDTTTFDATHQVSAFTVA